MFSLLGILWYSTFIYFLNYILFLVIVENVEKIDLIEKKSNLFEKILIFSNPVIAEETGETWYFVCDCRRDWRDRAVWGWVVQSPGIRPSPVPTAAGWVWLVWTGPRPPPGLTCGQTQCRWWVTQQALTDWTVHMWLFGLNKYSVHTTNRLRTGLVNAH